MAKGKAIDRATMREWATDAARIEELKAAIKPMADELDALMVKYKAEGEGVYGPIAVIGSDRVGMKPKAEVEAIVGPEIIGHLLSKTRSLSVKVLETV